MVLKQPTFMSKSLTNIYGDCNNENCENEYRRIISLQWGDEGKGKIVDFISNDYDLIARFQGGPNAGHTILIDQKYVLHTIPSEFLIRMFKSNWQWSCDRPITLCKELELLDNNGVDYSNNL